MELYKSKLNYPAKILAKPLSKLLTSELLYKPSRYVESYLAYLLGKGSGGTSINEEVRGALKNTYRDFPVIFDVGTNIGDWSKKLLELQPNAKLFQFEPSEICRDTIQKLNLPNTHLVPCAIGSQEGTATFYSASSIDPVDCSASLYQRRDPRWGEGIYNTSTVKVTTIDSVILQYSIDFVDFVKMDIEGHELEGLKGASQAFDNNKIGALSFEFGASNLNSKTFFYEFWDFLTKKDFKIYRVTPGNKLLEINDYYGDLEHFRGSTNYIARLINHPYLY
jgi:FkbM family methyltransferase